MPTQSTDRSARLIAALLGPVYLVSGLFILANIVALPQMVAAIVADPMLVVLSGYLTFVPGLAMLRFHRAWRADWRVLVTLSGWLFTAVGAARIVFAYRLAPVVGAAVAPALGWVPVLAPLFIAIGAVLAWHGWRRA